MLGTRVYLKVETTDALLGCVWAQVGSELMPWFVAEQLAAWSCDAQVGWAGRFGMWG